MNPTFINNTLLLTASGPPGLVNNVLFILLFLLFSITIFANVILIFVIYNDSSLHKPMYIFVLNLSMDGLIGSSAVCPKIMSNLLIVVGNISYEGCLLQVFFINVYATCAYAILTVMAYDRYVSICKPLQYHCIMTPSKVKLLLIVTYFIPLSILSVQAYLTSRLPLCRYMMHKLFCDNLAVLKLSCVKSTLSDLYGLFITVSLVVLPFLLVVLSYIKILLVSLKFSKGSKKKVLGTCVPHLIIFTNFSLAILFAVIYNRHSTSSSEINGLNSVQFILFPPLLHPIVYGLRAKEIRNAVRKILRRQVFILPHDVHLKPTPGLESSIDKYCKSKPDPAQAH